jgi:excinuclease UvrABC nuclease subunit
MARVHGVGAQDRLRLVREISRVLERDRSAVNRAIRALESLRDEAACRLMFEHAMVIHEQIRGLLWVVEAQKLLPLRPLDQDVSAVGVASDHRVRVTLQLRAGSLRQRQVKRLTGEPSVEPDQPAPGSDGWIELAKANAELIAKLAAADAIGPLGWREPQTS